LALVVDLVEYGDKPDRQHLPPHRASLSIARSIAQAHGGRLWARRNADHGLTFSLLLPEASQPQV